MLYKLFSSLKTSVYILSVMCVVFLVGTVFPQGEGIDDYINAGGKYVTIARALDFLDVFMSPLFIFVSGVLLINLAVCLYDRLRIFLKIKRRTLDFIRLKTHPNVVVLENPPFPPLSKGDVGGFDIEGALGKLGFKFKTEAQAVKIFEKGLQYWWLSWFYHVGIILAIIGFFLTALFAFEKDVVLSPDKPEQISLYSEDTRWNQFMKNLGKNVSEKQKISEYTLTLKEFRTEYYQGLKFDYPKDSASRLAMGLGIEKIEPAKKDFSYMPKRWLTSFNVKKPDDKGLDANVRVNKPFRTGGLTLYQMGYEQKIKLFVKKEMSISVQNKKINEKNPPAPPLRAMALLKRGKLGEIIDVEARVPFEVKDVKGKFVLGSLKLGTLYKKDGTKEKITPQAVVYYMPEKKQLEKEDLGTLRLGGSLKAKDLVFEMKDYKEASALSYRKDPGVWLVGLACLFVFIGLFVRSLGAWYRVQYAVEDSKAYLLISTRGILADRERIIKKLKIS